MSIVDYPGSCQDGQVILDAWVTSPGVTNHPGVSVFDTLCKNSPSRTATMNFNAVVGMPFQLELNMSINTASYIGAAAQGAGATVDARHRGKVFLIAPSGIRLDTASGATYQQPTMIHGALWFIPILLAIRP